VGHRNSENPLLPLFTLLFLVFLFVYGSSTIDGRNLRLIFASSPFSSQSPTPAELKNLSFDNIIKILGEANDYFFGKNERELVELSNEAIKELKKYAGREEGLRVESRNVGDIEKMIEKAERDHQRLQGTSRGFKGRPGIRAVEVERIHEELAFSEKKIEGMKELKEILKEGGDVERKIKEALEALKAEANSKGAFRRASEVLLKEDVLRWEKKEGSRSNVQSEQERLREEGRARSERAKGGEVSDGPKSVGAAVRQEFSEAVEDLADEANKRRELLRRARRPARTEVPESVLRVVRVGGKIMGAVLLVWEANNAVVTFVEFEGDSTSKLAVAINNASEIPFLEELLKYGNYFLTGEPPDLDSEKLSPLTTFSEIVEEIKKGRPSDSKVVAQFVKSLGEAYDLQRLQTSYEEGGRNIVFKSKCDIFDKLFGNCPKEAKSALYQLNTSTGKNFVVYFDGEGRFVSRRDLDEEGVRFAERRLEEEIAKLTRKIAKDLPVALEVLEEKKTQTEQREERIGEIIKRERETSRGTLSPYNVPIQ